MITQDRLLDELKQHAVAEYASPGARMIAGAIDLVLLTILQLVVVGVLGNLVMPASSSTDAAASLSVGAVLVVLFIPVLAVAYFAGSWYRWGRTPAMRMLGLRVVTAADQSPITVGTALLRFVAFTLTMGPAAIGFLIAFADPQRRTIYDRIAKTVVVAE